jgi:programmed cell death protein 5
MSGDEELEALRERRLLELQQNANQQQQKSEDQKRLEIQKQLMRRILTQKARQRLTNLKMVRPEFAKQLEFQLIQIAQQKSISLPIDDDQFKELLKRLQGDRKEIRIRRV